MQEEFRKNALLFRERCRNMETEEFCALLWDVAHSPLGEKEGKKEDVLYFMQVCLVARYGKEA